MGSSFTMSPRVRVERVPQLRTTDKERAVTERSVKEFVLERLNIATRLLQQRRQELLQLVITLIVLPRVNFWLLYFRSFDLGALFEACVRICLCLFC